MVRSNNYHILLIIHEQEVVAASIVDYLSEPNAGVIEFLVVHPDHRGRGLGRRLHDWTQQVLQADAARAGKRALDWIVAEMNDPFKTPRDSIDPFDRALVWHAWGYEKLRFPYVQPSLGDGKSPVLLRGKVTNSLSVLIDTLQNLSTKATGAANQLQSPIQVIGQPFGSFVRTNELEAALDRI
jgi:GNAT superfamily N-acetyltransferase